MCHSIKCKLDQDEIPIATGLKLVTIYLKILLKLKKNWFITRLKWAVTTRRAGLRTTSCVRVPCTDYGGMCLTQQSFIVTSSLFSMHRPAKEAGAPYRWLVHAGEELNSLQMRCSSTSSGSKHDCRVCRARNESMTGHRADLRRVRWLMLLIWADWYWFFKKKNTIG